MKYIIDTDRMAIHLAKIDEAERADFVLEVLRELHKGSLLVGWIKPVTKKKALPKNYSEWFNKFWDCYPKCPRKSAKKLAWKAWWSAADGEEVELLGKCVVALFWQSQTEGWTKENGAWIPMPSSWLNQARWEDEKPDEILKGTDASIY
jgi:hypothetical protein